jgi:transcription initiation factor IIE alpha subunit
MKAKVKTWLFNLQNGNLKTKNEKILNAIWKYTEERGGISTKRLRDISGYPHQTLTSVLSLLHDEGIIKVVGQVKDTKTDSFYSVYQFAEPNERNEISIMRKREKFNKTIERLMSAEFDGLVSPSFRNALNEQNNFNNLMA